MFGSSGRLNTSSNKYILSKEQQTDIQSPSAEITWFVENTKINAVGGRFVRFIGSLYLLWFFIS